MKASVPTYLSRISIVPLTRCVAHEGVVTRWVDKLAANLLDEGVMKNPIIVTAPRRGGRRIVIDGMHRFAALRQLGIPHVVVFEVDYESPTIQLAGWAALTLRSLAVRALLSELYVRQGYRLRTAPSILAAQRAVDVRRAVLAAFDGHRVVLVQPVARRAPVEECVTVSQQLDTALDVGDYHPLYVADSHALGDFRQTGAQSLFIRPHYTKREILTRTLAGKIFPRKSTRHVIPDRPLRVDVDLPILRAKISLAAKNKLLQERLHWCYEADRVRYYPEPVLVFSD